MSNTLKHSALIRDGYASRETKVYHVNGRKSSWLVLRQDVSVRFTRDDAPMHTIKAEFQLESREEADALILAIQAERDAAWPVVKLQLDKDAVRVVDDPEPLLQKHHAIDGYSEAPVAGELGRA